MTRLFDRLSDATHLDTAARRTLRGKRGRVDVEGVEGVSAVDAGQLLVADPGEAGVLAPISDALLLDVAWPEATSAVEVEVSGTTEAAARVVVVGAGARRATRADADGRFSVVLPVGPGEHDVEVRVRGAFGDEVVRVGHVVRNAAGRPLRVHVE